ncbi:MAG TPA: hypothetical protein VHR47_12130 [Bacillota bacterium]|nr:hypothetical protein [Bacillota bacterium]
MRYKWIHGFIAFALIFAVGCALAETSQPAADAGQIVKETAEPFGQIPLDDQYTLVNNTWNIGAATGPFKERVFLKEIDGKRLFGWEWEGKSNGKVVTYPSVIYGDKPWDPLSGRKSIFPIQAGSKKITLDFNVALKAKGTYDMAISLWGIRALPAVKENISHEIMIFTVNKGVSLPGSSVGQLEVSGTKYDLYKWENQTDDSGVHKNHWCILIFVARKPVLQGPVEVSAFIDYLIKKKLMTTEDYLCSLELGNEVISGSGHVEIDKYQVKFE